MASWGHSKRILVIRAGPGTALPQRNAVTQTPLASPLVPQGTPSGRSTQGEGGKGGIEEGEKGRNGENESRGSTLPQNLNIYILPPSSNSIFTRIL